MLEHLVGATEKMDANQAKMDTKPKEMKDEMLVKMEAHHERMMARMDSQLEKMEVCLGNTGAKDLEANPKETECEVKHEEVPKEEAAVESFGALKEWYRDQHLAVRCHGQPKKWT
jgi:hypothetical protein